MRSNGIPSCHVHTDPSDVVAVAAPLVPGLSESTVISSLLCCAVSSDVVMGKSVVSPSADEDASCNK